MIYLLFSGTACSRVARLFAHSACAEPENNCFGVPGIYINKYRCGQSTDVWLERFRAAAVHTPPHPSPIPVSVT